MQLDCIISTLLIISKLYRDCTGVCVFSSRITVRVTYLTILLKTETAVQLYINSEFKLSLE